MDGANAGGVQTKNAVTTQVVNVSVDRDGAARGDTIVRAQSIGGT
jgi:hypothetical protein